ncbi:MAG: hypothetical protein Q8L37_02695 [Candidatus Gottesmanbacteria bacterium]|nr:hypothetical protein [Candidatus Gottesmanbacteria bacterium]
MLTKQDKQYLKENFATKDDLKRFATKDETQTFIRVELARNEPELIRKISDKVTETLGAKIDKMYIKLDSFVGDIKARREEQAAHAIDHGRITDRFDHIDRHLGITTAE